MVTRFNRRDVLKYGSFSLATGMIGCTGQDGNGNEDFPTEPMRNIVPFSEGGGTDQYMRQIMPQLSEMLGQPVEIENIEGAASLRGTGEAYSAEPDGHTFVGFNPPSTPVSWLVNPQDWDIREFKGMGVYGTTAYCILAHPDTTEEYGLESYQDVIDVYQEGGITQIGGQRAGGVMHVMAHILRDEHGLEWEEYVGYDGSGPVLQAVASGEIPIGMTDDEVLVGAQDRVDVITVLASEGTPTAPDTPSVVDEGFENIDYISSLARCLYCPPETPDDRIQVLTEGLEEALNTDEVQEWAEETGNVVEYGPPEEADEALESALDEIEANVDIDEIAEEADS